MGCTARRIFFCYWWIHKRCEKIKTRQNKIKMTTDIEPLGLLLRQSSIEQSHKYRIQEGDDMHGRLDIIPSLDKSGVLHLLLRITALTTHHSSLHPLSILIPGRLKPQSAVCFGAGDDCHNNRQTIPQLVHRYIPLSSVKRA